MEHDLYEVIGQHYHTTLTNFFMPLGPEAIHLHSLIMEVVDDIQLNVNWYIPSTTVIRETLYAPIRSDQQVFNSLVKLERLMAMKLSLMGIESDFYGSLLRMFHNDGINESIADKDVAELMTRPIEAGRSGNLLTQVPGLVGLLTAIQYRHIWESLKRQ